MAVSQAALQARGRSTILHQSNMPVFGARLRASMKNSRDALDQRAQTRSPPLRHARRRAGRSPVDAAILAWSPRSKALARPTSWRDSLTSLRSIPGRLHHPRSRRFNLPWIISSFASSSFRCRCFGCRRELSRSSQIVATALFSPAQMERQPSVHAVLEPLMRWRSRAPLVPAPLLVGRQRYGAGVVERQWLWLPASRR